MLRLLVALALGANTQAFVVAPQHRLALPACARVRTTSPVLARSGSTRCHVRERRGGRSPPPGFTMRAARSGGDVRIEGPEGEMRRVKRSRRPDLRAMRRLGLQTAAAVVVGQPKVDVAGDLTQSSSVSEVEQAVSEKKAGGTDLAEKIIELEALAAKNKEENGGDMIDELASGSYIDKHTKLYVPTDGVIIKKTYGFWTWQAFGFIFIQHFVRALIRKGGNVKKTAMSEINWDHVVTEPEHLKELKAYCCDQCGYTLFPARGRHEHFFDDVDDFKCPECEAPRSSFYDANDPDDPHNQRFKEDSGEKGEGDPDKGVTTADADAGNAEVSAEGGGAPTTASEPKSSMASEAPSPEEAPPELPEERSAEGSSDTSPSEDDREDTTDDLLDL